MSAPVAAEPRVLRAGSLEVHLDGPDVRYVRYGELEVVRRIFVGIRDVAWKTLAPDIRSIDVEERDDEFRVRAALAFETPLLALSAEVTIDGRSDGALRYAVEMTAERDFDYSRLGICVLHPAELCAGRRYVTRGPGGLRSGTLPTHIGPQELRDGVIYPLLDAFEDLEIDMDGVAARFAFQGDLFELEDQRNWTDASFKTYSTQLALGLPHRATAGEVLTQHVDLSLTGAPPARRPRPQEARVTIGPAVGHTLPPLGLGMASHDRGLDDHGRDLLRALEVDHLRVDLRLGADDWRDRLAEAAEVARTLGAGLELALFVAAPTRRELPAVAAALDGVGDLVRRVLVLHEGTETTPAPWVPEVRRQLAAALPDGVPFAGGTNLFFTEINRVRPVMETMDGLAWSINASVHATDDRSIVETIAPQAEQVRSARAFAEDRKLFVGPVTLRMRWNAHARLGIDDEPAPDELPFPVDARQPLPFTAAWAVGSLGRLARAGVDALTYFETTGWRGLVETDEPRPERFPSRPGEPFPVYDVFVALAGWRGAELLDATTTDPLRAEALAVRRGASVRVLVANLASETQAVRVDGLGQGRAEVAAPEWSAHRVLACAAGSIAVELAPYGVAVVDVVLG